MRELVFIAESANDLLLVENSSNWQSLPVAACLGRRLTVTHSPCRFVSTD